MIDFIPIQGNSKEVITKYLKYNFNRSCDIPFATLYLWRDFYHMEYAVVDDHLITHTCYDRKESFSVPIGENEPIRAMNALIVHCKEKGIPCILNSITRDEEELINRYFPGQFQIEFNRDYYDYIYETADMISLKGKKYHGKRNHINKFMKLFDWSYETITDENMEECLEMLAVWEKENQGVSEENQGTVLRLDEDTGMNQEMDPEWAAEIAVSREALEKREFLELKSGLIRADGQVVAFTLGEEIAPDTFCIHVEKAISKVQGSYAMINQQFLIHEAANYRYVNREDDLGEPGLRKAKLSYHPAFLLEKGEARYIG